MTATVELLPAIYQKLAPGDVLDSQLAALGIQAVYDFRNVPENAAFDYITIGDGYEISDDTFDGNGWRNTATIHIFSRETSVEYPNKVLKRLNDLLHRQVLSLPTLHNVFLRYSGARWKDDPDGLTLHIIATYQTYTTT
jgi:hypothetical protein